MSSVMDDFKNAFGKPNNGLIQIILVNVIVFVTLAVLGVFLQIGQLPQVFQTIFSYVALPADVRTFVFRPWTLFTYSFAHSITYIFHIFFNMLTLYWFGKLIDEYLGNRRLVNLYILGGLAGGLLYLLMYNLVPYFMESRLNTQLIGASGAVYAVVVAAATLMPNYTFHLLLIGPVRIKYIAAFTVFVSFLSTIGQNAGGNLAHLGGALLGFVFIRQLRSGNDLGRPLTAFNHWVTGLFRRKPKMRVSYQNKAKVTQKAYSASGNASTYSAPNQDEIDNILDKISRSGYESLTKDEKQKLFRASQRKE